MNLCRNVTEQIFWVGGNDRRLSRFENLFPLSEGMAYNAYVIKDEKNVLLDTVDSSVTMQFLENLETVLAGETLDYLVINHMEPDHCANIETLMKMYPNLKLIGNVKTFQLYEQFYRLHDQDRYIVVKEGEELNIGKHTLKFFLTPMVHWPEVMMTYEMSQGILFSADAFGAFGAHDGNLFADETDYSHKILAEARRYYVNIVGKFGANVIATLKKISSVDIKMICPLHGPIFKTEEDITMILDYYQHWATLTPENDSVLIVYGSMYGNTENAAYLLANELADKGVKDIKMYDVSGMDASYIIADMWRYRHIVFASPNYNVELYFKMDNLIREALALNFKNRQISIMVNYSWGGKALKTMQDYFADSKHFTMVGDPVEIKSSVKDDNVTNIKNLATAIYQSLQ